MKDAQLSELERAFELPLSPEERQRRADRRRYERNREAYLKRAREQYEKVRSGERTRKPCVRIPDYEKRNRYEREKYARDKAQGKTYFERNRERIMAYRRARRERLKAAKAAEGGPFSREDENPRGEENPIGDDNPRWERHPDEDENPRWETFTST